MTGDDAPLEDTAEDLFEHAPCGYVSTRMDGTIVKVNRTFEQWTGWRREDLVGARRLQDVLAPGGRIYYDTHIAPLLMMQQEVRGIAVEVLRADGGRAPALISSVVRADADGRPRVIRTSVFDASDRRRYEQELLRARRHEQEIAQELQRSLLAGELPADDALELEVAYRPAVRGLDVGGDWYDAFWLREGERVALVVGDVVGRGIGAAAAMGQLRSASRALAATVAGPGPLLEALDEYARRHRVGRMTTLVCAELDLRTRELRYACAGHPPPVALDPRAEPELLWEGRSLPLDAHHAVIRPRAQGERRLTAGSAVALYTDGLVERRRRTLDEGFDRLLLELDRRREEPLERLAAGLMRTLADPDDADDVCLLLARLR